MLLEATEYVDDEAEAAGLCLEPDVEYEDVDVETGCTFLAIRTLWPLKAACIFVAASCTPLSVKSGRSSSTFAF